MTQFLIEHFVKDYEDVEKISVFMAKRMHINIIPYNIKAVSK